MKARKTGTGFTLVELLVVIAIIGLLSSIVLASLNTARAKSRDARRKEDLYQIRTALELYYTDNGHYPIISSPWACSATTNLGNCSNASWNNLATQLHPYIPSLPKDPVNTNISDPTFDGNLTYAYYSTSSGSDYDLIALLEVTTDADRCAKKGYIDAVYSAAQGTTYYWCSPFSPTVSRSAQLYADH